MTKNDSPTIDNGLIETTILERDTLHRNKSFLINEKTKIDKDKKYLNEINSTIRENLELTEIIGIGCDTKVYKCLVKQSKKIISLKLFLKKNKKTKNNFIEMNIINKLKHKNIINYYGAIIDDAFDCMILENGKHGNLKEFKINVLKQEYLPESLLCFISYQILNGLKYIHLSKIAHFDIKPENIIINEFLDVKIIDFSVSLDYDKLLKNNIKEIKTPFRGTNFYMSPQVLKIETININDLDKIDLYSLGVLLYYLAFNSMPFGLNKNDSKKYDIIFEKITKNLIFDKEGQYYSSHFINFLKKLLEKDINKRINIQEAMNDYWIKGTEILINEKEKVNNATIFLYYLLTDHYKVFNDYIQK